MKTRKPFFILFLGVLFFCFINITLLQSEDSKVVLDLKLLQKAFADGEGGGGAQCYDMTLVGGDGLNWHVERGEDCYLNGDHIGDQCGAEDLCFASRYEWPAVYCTNLRCYW